MFNKLQSFIVIYNIEIPKQECSLRRSPDIRPNKNLGRHKHSLYCTPV